MRGLRVCAVGAALAAAPALFAQQTPIAYVPTAGVTVSGSLSVENGSASIGNNGTITAGDSAALVKLVRGGELKVCATTKVHLSRDTSFPDADSALMIALDRGALEASYQTGKYSDVVLTPDLRILISGPGVADLKIRVNEKGDTCLDNHGVNAPYVTVTSQFEGGLYRVQANQRVMFEDGSLQKVVDNETEACGCPAPVAPVTPVVAASVADGKPAPVAKAEAANPFPVAQSEGLAAPPPAPTQPVVPVGTVHAEVEAPIGYDAAKTPNPAAPGAVGTAPEGVADAAAGAPSAPVAAKPKKQGGFFHSIGHFFARMFGK
jgi:hypothetical protein